MSGDHQRRALEKLEYWTAQAAQVEREERLLVWALRVGLPAGIAAAVLGFVLVGALVGGMALLTYGLGRYMTAVRRAEFAERVRDAAAEVEARSRADGDVS